MHTSGGCVRNTKTLAGWKPESRPRISATGISKILHWPTSAMRIVRTWFYAEVAKAERGEVAAVRREADHGFWARNVFTLLLPDRSEAERLLTLLDPDARLFHVPDF